MPDEPPGPADGDPFPATWGTPASPGELPGGSWAARPRHAAQGDGAKLIRYLANDSIMMGNAGKSAAAAGPAGPDA